MLLRRAAGLRRGVAGLAFGPVVLAAVPAALGFAGALPAALAAALGRARAGAARRGRGLAAPAWLRRGRAGAAACCFSSSATRAGQRLDLRAQPLHVLQDAQVVEALADPLRRGRDVVEQAATAVARPLGGAGGGLESALDGAPYGVDDVRGPRPLSSFAAFLSFLGMVAAVYVAVSAAATIHLRPHETVAERVLVPGDPGRALRLAQLLLEKPKMLNHNRGLWGYSARPPTASR